MYQYKITSTGALQIAQYAFLDALGCAMEKLNSREYSAFIGPSVQGCVVHNGLRLPGASHEPDPLKGAFEMETLIRYLERDDGFTGATWGHPSGRTVFIYLTN